MSLEDDVRKCCDDIERVHSDTKRVKTSHAAATKEDLSKLEAKVGRFRHEAAEARKKLDSGVREGLEGLVNAWRDARDRLRGHLRLIEAKSVLKSAQRLAADQYYVAAEKELAVVLALVKEAQPLLPRRDTELADLVQRIERAVADIRTQASTTAAALEQVATDNERLLGQLDESAA